MSVWKGLAPFLVIPVRADFNKCRPRASVQSMCPGDEPTCLFYYLISYESIFEIESVFWLRFELLMFIRPILDFVSLFPRTYSIKYKGLHRSYSYFGQLLLGLGWAGSPSVSLRKHGVDVVTGLFLCVGRVKYP